MTKEQRFSEVFELSNRQFKIMLAGAVVKIGTDDEELGWQKVSKNMDRLDRIRDFGLYTSKKPAEI
jgi:hypothetical protein